MGSGASRHRLLPCLRPSAGGGGATTASDDYYHNNPIFERGPLDEALGHSFCYVRSSTPAHSRSSSVASFAGGGGGEGGVAETAFRTISGASVSANSSTPLPLYDSASRSHPAGFRSSSSFSAIPLQLSAPGGSGAASGPLDRGFFLSGPIERGALSGPLEPVPFSGPLVKKKRRGLAGRLRKPSLLRRSISEKNRPWVVPLRSFNGRRGDVEDDAHAAAAAEGNVQWAHGRAGEDRVHVVVSEEHRWLFIGIFDGFNGPEAPEFLVGSLYRAVFNELRDLFWEEVDEGVVEDAALDKGSDKRATFEEEGDGKVAKRLWEFLAEADCDRELDFSGSGRFAFSLSKPRYGIGSWRKDGRGVWFPKWRYDSEAKAKEAAELSSRRRRKKGPVADHGLVLNALSRALESTEAAYLDITDKVMDCNPELALMGSCLLVMLMRDEDVYVMNVGDSRAIVAQYRSQMDVDGSMSIECNLDLERRSMDEGGRGIGRNGSGGEIEGISRGAVELVALQLSTDHSTSIAEEVHRIKREHPDDSQCIVNNRVKGRLKVTRAFGAGYLKQPKWNNGLLEMFRNEYIGTAPYISCTPSLCHHKLGANDQFLVLSSDGLYQYFNNEEVVLHVESFMERFPDGDPAQSLIEELLYRAAKKAGMDFYELVDIPQGDRRKYHDDVTVMVISLEGRIWKSSGKCVKC